MPGVETLRGWPAGQRAAYIARKGPVTPEAQRDEQALALAGGEPESDGILNGG